MATMTAINDINTPIDDEKQLSPSNMKREQSVGRSISLVGI